MAGTRVRFTVDALELFPDDGLRREVVDGELFVSEAPHPDHQEIIGRFYRSLADWNDAKHAGRVAFGIGIVFSRESGVIPDLVWASHARWAASVNEAGRLVRAPEIVLEVLSPDAEDERRDREVKLKLYSARGVDEYWIADRFTQAIEVYRREDGVLALVMTLRPGDTLR